MSHKMNISMIIHTASVHTGSKVLKDKKFCLSALLIMPKRWPPETMLIPTYLMCVQNGLIRAIRPF